MTLSLFALGNYEMARRSWLGCALAIAGTILVAALMEEIVFRGVLFRVLEGACRMPWPPCCCNR